jgi:hypothetical protein
MLKKIRDFACLSVLVVLTCDPGAPRDPTDKSFFIGTWHSSNKCMEYIVFSDTGAQWLVNYRACLSDTIKNPSRYVDSITYDAVQDSFLVMDYKGWQASDTELVFLDTVKMPGGNYAASKTSLHIQLWSSFQFYVKSAGDTSKVLFTKQ